MKNINRINLLKKFFACIFTFCLAMYNISYMPTNFSYAMSINSNKKIYIDGNLCIDGSNNEYKNDNVTISYSEKHDACIIDVNSNSTLGAITAENEPNVIIRMHGASTINSSNGYSISGVKDLIFFDEDYSQEVLNLKGGISFSGSLGVYRNISIDSENELSSKGIENGKSIILENSKLNIHITSPAFTNISGKLLVGSGAELNIKTDSKAFDSVSKVAVTEGGKINIQSKEKDLGTSMYSYWTNWNDKLWNSKSLPTTTEKVVDLNAQDKANNKYSYTFSDRNGSNEYYNWFLSSLDAQMIRVSYGTDLFGISDNDINGKFEVVSGIGQELYTTESGAKVYKLKSNSEVKIRAIPYDSYQVNTSDLNSFGLKSQDTAGEYIFTVPNNNIHLTDLFIGSGRTLNALSSDVRTLETTVDYKNETLKVILEDKNKVLDDDNGELSVTLVEENSDRYKEILENLDDKKSEVEHRVFFDVVIYKNKDDHKQGTYSKLENGKVNILFQIPKGWDKEELQAMLIHSMDTNDKGTDLAFDEEIVTKDGIDYLSFATDHFSPYALSDELSDEEWEKLLAELNNVPNNNEPSQENLDQQDANDSDNAGENEVLATGDNTNKIVVSLTVVAIVSLIAFIMLKRFDKNKKNI